MSMMGGRYCADAGTARSGITRGVRILSRIAASA